MIGIPLAFLFAQNFMASLYPPLLQVLPWTLAIPPNNSAQPSVAMAVMIGAAPASYLPLYTALVCSALFIAVALWAFQRQEL